MINPFGRRVSSDPDKDSEVVATAENTEQEAEQQPERIASRPTAFTPENQRSLWRRCNKCDAPILLQEAIENDYICPKCGCYFRMPAEQRIRMLADEGSFEEWDPGMETVNPLNFPGYEGKIQAAREKSGLDEAVVSGKARIMGTETVLVVCDGNFMMSSMGHNMGEKITRAFERATRERLPVIIYAASGGARMQEGIISLMQMAKTSAAVKEHSDAGLLFISVLTDPTTGGVTASFAMLGDIILAEPGAQIGFAGPRVIEQTINQKLPEGFQKAEFQEEHGFVDLVVDRKDQREILGRLLKLHAAGSGWQTWSEENRRPVSLRSALTETMSELVTEEDSNSLISRIAPLSGLMRQKTLNKILRRAKEPWETVHQSRKACRLMASDYIDAMFDDFTELHGDRYFGDDGAIIGGIGSYCGMPVTVIGQERGKTPEECRKHNYGMPSPEGYRKALRLMKQAEKFKRPVICFVDTPGAYPGREAEERGQGEAIARNLYEMSTLRVPVLSIVTGQGGSGGALALAVANEVWMLENATYSILSPEGFASILWKDAKRADEAAKVMKMTSEDLYKLGIIDRIICEDEPATADSLPEIVDIIDRHMRDFFTTCAGMDSEAIVRERKERFRNT